MFVYKNKMKHFSYKGGLGYMGVHVIKAIKRKLAYAVDERLQVNSSIMLFKQLYH